MQDMKPEEPDPRGSPESGAGGGLGTGSLGALEPRARAEATAWPQPQGGHRVSGVQGGHSSGTWAVPRSGLECLPSQAEPENVPLASVSPPAPEPDSDQHPVAGGVRTAAQPGALAALGTLPRE